MPSRRRIADPVRERAYRCGTLSLRTLDLALLRGLLDRQDGAALGAQDLIRAARPYTLRYRWYSPNPNESLRTAIPGLPTAWVARSKVGRLTRYQLLPRGRDVVEGRLPARLGGRGRYVPGAWRAAK